MQKIETMLQLQQDLNDTTNGPGWEYGTTRNGKPIDWRRCIWLEAAELVESYPWKHWKNIDADPDEANIRIEAVDIWHFVMSEALRRFALEQGGALGDLAQRMTANEAYRRFADPQRTWKRPDPYQAIEEVERLIAMLFADEPIEAWTAQFFRIASQSGLDLNTLYALYVGKNILNRFRQDHGYKEGRYRKTWDGQEDNAVMQSLLRKEPSLTPQALYERLATIYRVLEGESGGN